MKIIIFYIVLILFIACPWIYSQPVTTQEIAALKTEIQALSQKYKNLKYKTQNEAQIITSLKELFERLNEVNDMPLSRPEADQIKARIDQLK